MRAVVAFAGLLAFSQGLVLRRRVTSSTTQLPRLIVQRAPTHSQLSSSALQLFGKKWDPAATIRATKKTPDLAAFVSYVGATAVQFTLLLTILHLIQIKILKALPAFSFTLPALFESFPFWSSALHTPAVLFPGATLSVPAAVKTAIGVTGNFALKLPAWTFPALNFPSLSQATSELALGSSSQNVAVFVLGLFLALRSRVASPLNNRRPKANANDPVFKNRRRPWFQPPPLAFPLIWTSIAFLRAAATTIVFNTTGTLLCAPIFALMLHLSIGDTWNTINNVEKRLGTAALTVPAVFASAVFAVQQTSLVSTTAAYVLAPMAAWLAVATLLVNSIWQLNYLLFDRPSLFPSKEEGPPSAWRLPFTSYNS